MGQSLVSFHELFHAHAHLTCLLRSYVLTLLLSHTLNALSSLHEQINSTDITSRQRLR